MHHRSETSFPRRYPRVVALLFLAATLSLGACTRETTTAGSEETTQRIALPGDQARAVSLLLDARPRNPVPLFLFGRERANLGIPLLVVTKEAAYAATAPRRAASMMAWSPPSIRSASISTIRWRCWPQPPGGGERLFSADVPAGTRGKTKIVGEESVRNPRLIKDLMSGLAFRSLSP